MGGSTQSPAGDGAPRPPVLAHLTWREAHPGDAAAVTGAIDTWWPKVHIVHGVCPQLLEHMGDTCVIAEDDGVLVGFLIGYLSQRRPDAGYVHYAGVTSRVPRSRPGTRAASPLRGAGARAGPRLSRRRDGALEQGLDRLPQERRLHAEPGDIVVDGIPGWRDATGVGCDYVTMALRLDEGTL